MRRAAAPLWFQLLVAVAGAVCLRCLGAVHVGPPPLVGDGYEVQLAFWPLIAVIASAIWTGLQAAGQAILTALVWSVKALWWFATVIANGVKKLGVLVAKGAKEIWEFSRATYEHVLKPAWEHLRKWYEAFHTWWDKTFGPVLDFLRATRDWIVCFWKTWIQPWLDLIDVTRRVLRVLSALGLEWARALDAKLGALEDRIYRPFQLLLAKVNEIINLVDRVVTLDGLFQRVALIASLVRDYNFAWRALVGPGARSIPDSERSHLPELPVVTGLPDDVVIGLRVYLEKGTGPYVGAVERAAAVWRSSAGAP